MWEGISSGSRSKDGSQEHPQSSSTHNGYRGFLYDTSARETEDAWLQVSQILYEVGTETIPVVPQGREIWSRSTPQNPSPDILIKTLGIGLRRSRVAVGLLPFIIGDVDDLAWQSHHSLN